MQRKIIDPATLQHVKPYLEMDLAGVEKATPETVEAIRAWLTDPNQDITGLRLDTLVTRANTLKLACKRIEEHLKRLQGEDENL